MSVEVANIKFTKYDDDGNLTRRGEAVKITGFVTPTDPQVDRLRIYRLGGTLNEYLLEQEVPWDTVEFTSFESDVAIAANPILSFENDVPFTTLVPSDESEDIPGQYIEEEDEFGITAPTSLYETPMGRAWGPFAGSYIFACGDPYRPGVVYWTNAGNPDGASDLNEVQVTSTITPLQNGFVFGGNSYTWTKDDLYALDWSGPTAIPAFIPRKTPLGMGLSAPEAFAVGTKGVFFLSKDGIYVTDCQTYAQSITEDSLKPIFLGQEVGVGDADAGDEVYLKPLNWDDDWISECYLMVAANELHFLYWDTGRENDEGETVPARTHLVYDIQKNRWQKFKPANDRYAAYVYGDINRSKYTVLMALNDGFVYTVDEDLEEGDQVSLEDYYAEIPFTCEVRTGSGDLGRPLLEKEFGAVQVDVAPYGKVIDLKPLYNAEHLTGTALQINENGTDSERKVYPFYSPWRTTTPRTSPTTSSGTARRYCTRRPPRPAWMRNSSCTGSTRKPPWTSLVGSTSGTCTSASELGGSGSSPSAWTVLTTTTSGRRPSSPTARMSPWRRSTCPWSLSRVRSIGSSSMPSPIWYKILSHS